jgi:hypothetical protein
MVDIVRGDKKKKKYPSLYDEFKLGQRVIRTYEDKYGNKSEYKGIILAIDKNGIEVYWDTLDGNYKPRDMFASFTYCNSEEIFYGDEKYSPIKKEFYYD